MKGLYIGLIERADGCEAISELGDEAAIVTLLDEVGRLARVPAAYEAANGQLRQGRRARGRLGRAGRSGARWWAAAHALSVSRYRAASAWLHASSAVQSCAIAVLVTSSTGLSAVDDSSLSTRSRTSLKVKPEDSSRNRRRR